MLSSRNRLRRPQTNILMPRTQLIMVNPSRPMNAIADLVHHPLTPRNHERTPETSRKLPPDSDSCICIPTSLATTVSHLKILGVTFQENLSWNEHINYLSKTASRRIYLLKTLKKISGITKQDLVTIYNSIVVSVLEHNSPLFIGMTKSNN